MDKTKVTSNMLENISNRIKNQGFSNSEGKALVLFNGASKDIFNHLGYLENLKKNGIEISLGFSYMSEKILDTNKIINKLKPREVFKEEDIFKLKSIINDYSMVIGPNITINTLSKVSLGMIDSFVPNIIWTFLYNGKKVYLNFNSVRNYLGVKPQSSEISNIIEKHISTIIKMGAQEITEDTIFDKITPNILSSKIIAPFNDIDLKKDLITEKDISLLKNQTKLVLKKGTVITPLAKDKARELGISIEIK